MTDFDRIKNMFGQRGELWEDPDFPATQSSVFYHQTPPFNFVWKRAREIVPNSTFVNENSDSFDVVPGKLGDKWLVSCLGVLFMNKGLFHIVVPADQRTVPYAGVFRFRLWWCGQWMEVLVDDRLPTVNGKLAFLQTTHTNQLWPSLLEKAYAKLHGSYEALKYGSLLDGLADLTGGITESIPEIPDVLTLTSLLRTTSVVTVHHCPVDVAEEKLPDLKVDMNYVITQIERVDYSSGPVDLVKLQRPLAPSEIQPTYVMDPANWLSMPVYERRRLTTSSKGFWMLYSDFRKQFDRVEMVHLDAETSGAEPSLTDKHTWQMKMHQGSWKRGVSAGGCRNYVDFFHMNPQIQLTLMEPDTVVISLNQHSIMEPKVIGFSIYKMPKFLEESASAAFFKKNKSAINSQYTNSRQVSHRCQLEAGAYLVMPTTFEPREEAEFTLRIFSTNPLNITALDYRPQMLKSALIRAPNGVEASCYEAVFLQLANEHRMIDAFELQELLDACLPNDYIKSCASIETCRQIVLTMDNDNKGRISLTDFKDLMCTLKHWQLVFKEHAREKMGVIRAERLRDALAEVGFVLPERAMALVVIRYMRKDGMLRFGDFVSAVMHLSRTFGMFFESKSRRYDMLNLDLSEWLQCTLTC